MAQGLLSLTALPSLGHCQYYLGVAFPCSIKDLSTELARAGP